MRAAALALPLACLLASAAAAGPWPRAPGGVFVATTAGVEEIPAGRRAFAEGYAEYGLDGRLTFGAKLRHRARRAQGDLLARWNTELWGHLALGVTLGARLGADDGLPVAPLLGAHLGRGIETGRGNLWARADLWAAGNRRQGIGGWAEIEVSAQLGLRTGRGGLAMLTLADHRDRAGRTVKLSPALGWAVDGRSTVVVGATLLPRGRRLDGAQLSLWLDF